MVVHKADKSALRGNRAGHFCQNRFIVPRSVKGLDIFLQFFGRLNLIETLEHFLCLLDVVVGDVVVAETTKHLHIDCLTVLQVSGV